MNDFVLARMLHVLGVVMWIGGVSMVTTVLLPAIRRLKQPAERVEFFEQVESRFAHQARFTTLLTGLSGFYMIYVLHAWDRFLHPAYWWMHAMVLTWLIFTVMLFVLEPFVLHRRLKERAKRDPEGTFTRIERMHRVLLVLSLATVLGAVAGSHGWLWFQ